jgi:hypothetical protein
MKAKSLKKILAPQARHNHNLTNKNNDKQPSIEDLQAELQDCKKEIAHMKHIFNDNMSTGFVDLTFIKGQVEANNKSVTSHAEEIDKLNRNNLFLAYGLGALTFGIVLYHFSPEKQKPDQKDNANKPSTPSSIIDKIVDAGKKTNTEHAQAEKIRE